MEECIFCRIIKGDVPSFKVLEDENHLAILTIQPFKEGHTLVIPKVHVDYFFEMEDQALAQLMIFAKQVSAKLEKAFHPASGKIGVMVAGEQMPHVHVHLVPFDNALDLSFARARPISEEELQKTLKKIQQS